MHSSCSYKASFCIIPLGEWKDRRPQYFWLVFQNKPVPRRVYYLCRAAWLLSIPGNIQIHRFRYIQLNLERKSSSYCLMRFNIIVIDPKGFQYDHPFQPRAFQHVILRTLARIRLEILGPTWKFPGVPSIGGPRVRFWVGTISHINCGDGRNFFITTPF